MGSVWLLCPCLCLQDQTVHCCDYGRPGHSTPWDGPRAVLLAVQRTASALPRRSQPWLPRGHRWCTSPFCVHTQTPAEHWPPGQSWKQQWWVTLTTRDVIAQRSAHGFGVFCPVLQRVISTSWWAWRLTRSPSYLLATWWTSGDGRCLMDVSHRLNTIKNGGTSGKVHQYFFILEKLIIKWR